MKSKKCRVISFILIIMVMATVFAGNMPVKAYSSDLGPDILITEIMPLSDSDGDTHEYIELFNNSENSINLEDYKFVYPDVDISSPKVVPPNGVIVLCINKNTTLDEFNDFYNTALTDDKYLDLQLTDDALNNGSGNYVILAKDDGNIVAYAKYDSADFDESKSVEYKYTRDDFYMSLLRGRQTPTPGMVKPDQVPYKGTAVTGITLDRSTISMEINETALLKATVSPITAANKSVTWSSSKTDVAVVNSNGLITAKSAGTCLITATTADGGYDATCAVSVGRVPVLGVTLNKTSVTLDVGKIIVLIPTIIPENATNKSVRWFSSNSAVASVSSDGVVTARTPGRTTIMVKTVDGAYPASCTVIVNNTGVYVPVTGIYLSPNATVEVDRAIVLSAAVKPSNATNKKLIWKSNKSYIASVDQNGIVYGKTAGDAYITATTEDGGYSASCKVTVKDKTDDGQEVTGVKLNTREIFLEIGEIEKLDASVLPYDASNKNVIWASEDKSVATVDADGNVKGVNAGNTFITVKTVENGYVDKCLVIVGKDSYNYDSGIIRMWLNRASVNLFEGHTANLNVKILPHNSYNKKIIWTTSDKMIATVDSNGKVTGHNCGDAVITAATQDGLHTVQCYVHVSRQNGKAKGWGRRK